MKTCAYCGHENSDAATTCTECGTAQPRSAEQAPPAGNELDQVRLRDILDDPIRLFRALVVTATVTYVAGFFHYDLTAGLISRGAHDALEWDRYGALLTLPPAVYWLSLLLHLAVAVGLWTFSKSARFIFATLIAFFTVLILFFGVFVGTPYGGFLAAIMGMADGAVLVMAFTSPLKDRFR